MQSPEARGENSGRWFEPWHTTSAGEQSQTSFYHPEAGGRTAEVGSKPGTLLEQVSSDKAQCRVESPREKTADVGSNAGTLVERVGSDRAESSIQRPGERIADVGSNPGTLPQRVSSDKAESNV